MSVSVGERGRGIGRTLLIHAERWAAGTNALRRIDLHVRPDSASAVLFCLRAGYLEVGEFTEVRFHGRRPIRYLRMEKRLAMTARLVMVQGDP